jgi:uncharacterized membrane protein
MAWRWVFLSRKSDGSKRPGANANQRRDDARPARAPGILLGIGLGGFVDGSVLHQVLQWHHLLSSESGYRATTVAGLEENMLADGLFHAFTWIIVVGGLWVRWRRTGEWRWARAVGLSSAGRASGGAYSTSSKASSCSAFACLSPA